MTRQIKSVEDLLMEGGGCAEIGRQLNISPWSIIKWKERGVPQKFWDALMKHYDITPAELFSITKKAKKN